MTLDVQSIESEVLAGLPNDRRRLDDAMFNLEFYNGDFSRFPVRRPGEDDGDRSRKRHSLIMQRIVNVLTANLYKEGPKRTIEGHDQAADWLGEIYRRNGVDALCQQADRWSMVSEVAAFQAEPSANPDKPVRVRLWDASQFLAWSSPDEPTEAAAVAVIDRFDNSRRLRLYTDAEVRVYRTGKLGVGQTSGGTAYRLVEARPNPLGFLPFSFVHFNLPICDFWSGGPGCYLRSVNDVANAALTDGFDSLSVNLLPVLLLSNVRPGYSPGRARPGAVWELPADKNDVADGGKEPKAEYLQADPGYIAAGWEDLQNYLDHVMEMMGVPPAAVRMVQDSARSGVSIVAEQIPLITWAEGRQRPAAYYEQALARLVMKVGAKVYGGQALGDHRATASQLEAAAKETLSLRWPKMYPEMPGPEADQSDQWLLDNGLASRVTVLMRREKWTREEAEAHLEEIAKDLANERAMFGPRPEPAAPAAPVPTPEEGADTEDDDLEPEDENP
jgi:hypothetical protein